jgi:hypothetical protein
VACVDEADSELEAEARVLPVLREAVARLLDGGGLNPWCGLCGAGVQEWAYEAGRTHYSTIAEAMPEVNRLGDEQAATAALFGQHGPARPKPN